MLAFKFCLLSAIFVFYCVPKCELAGKYTIGFEGFGGSNNKSNPTHPPKPNPTYRPSPPKPNPTYRPSPPNPTYRPSNSKPNPTYRPSPAQPNPTYRPAPPNPTYRPAPPKSNITYYPPPPKSTVRPVTRRTTPKPTPPPKPTSPPLWNIWTSSYVPKQGSVPLKPKTPPSNNFKSDATLFGLYTLMRNIIGVTLSQTGQSKPVKKPLHESYPYYYAVYHYNKDRERVSNKIVVPYDSLGYCDAGTSDRTCVPGTYALCLLDWTIMCITYSTATLPCHFNSSLQCATARSSCDSRDPICAAMGNIMEVQTPCISNVILTSPSTVMGSITQAGTADPYSTVISTPIDLCATTILEMKKLESPLGAVVGLFTELGKAHVEFINNFNATHYVTSKP